MNNTALKPFVALCKREMWEHRSFWIVQLVIGALATIGTLAVCSIFLYAYFHGNFYVDKAAYASLYSGGHGGEGFKNLILASVGPFNVALIIVVTIYLVDTLTSDRRDRSILFWRSMPISDTETVLSKLFTATVSAPALMLVIAMAFTLLGGIIWAIAFLIIGVNPFLMIHPLWALLAIITLAWALIVQSLWMLPFYGFFMLCSAWAKRIAIGWVLLVPLSIIFLEGVIFRTGNFAKMIGHHFAGLFDLLVGKGGFVINADSRDVLAAHGSTPHLMNLGTITSFLFQPEMLISVIIGAIFIGGAMWLRHNRNEV